VSAVHARPALSDLLDELVACDDPDLDLDALRAEVAAAAGPGSPAALAARAGRLAPGHLAAVLRGLLDAGVAPGEAPLAALREHADPAVRLDAAELLLRLGDPRGAALYQDLIELALTAPGPASPLPVHWIEDSLRAEDLGEPGRELRAQLAARLEALPHA